jgi:SAM-dependent methyltransferase
MDTDWDQRYLNRDTPWDTDRPASELLRIVEEQAITPCRTLEVACGTGTNAVHLAGAGFEVTAVDVSRTALARAGRRAAAAGVAVCFIQADVFDLPELGEPFPFILDVGGYHALRRINEARLVSIYERLLAPGGRMLILAGNAREPLDPGPPTVSEQEIHAAFDGVFDIVQLREFRFDSTPDGHTHPLAWSILLGSRRTR